MNESVSPNFHKWIKRCLRGEFENVIEEALEENEECSDIAERIIRSKEMSTLLNNLRAAITEQYAQEKSASVLTSDSRPESSFSLSSDIIGDDWNSPKSNEDQYNSIIDKISCDKPVHVRLAGYEILLKSELLNLSNSTVWDLLEKTLMDGLTDESRPVFEASLEVHAKLLTSPQAQNVYTNLLNAFNAQYHSQKSYETLPTLISGINFKFFLHERLFRIMHLIIRYQEELLKGVRNVDKAVEEIVEQFIIFLSTHEFGSAMQSKTLNMLNIVSVLEPRADWSKRWIVSLATRRTFITMLAKSPSFLQNVIEYVNKGLEQPPHSTTISIWDDPVEVCINGSTIEAVTYLHCLCFVSQLCAYEAGRTLLSESTQETPFSVPEFLTASLKTLNKLSSDTSNGVYDVSCYALQSILEKPKISYDTDFYHVALCHLVRTSKSDLRIWPYTLAVMLHLLDTADGSSFLISECKEHSVATDSDASKCPATVVVLSASNMLKQPFSIMNSEYLLSLFKVMEKLFDIFDAYEVVEVEIENDFYPAVAHFYNRLDKCYFENESKTQQINSAVKKLLLKIVSVPFGLRTLVKEPVVFEELIRGCIAPLRTSWTLNEVVSFVAFAACFQLGHTILADLASHVLSTLLMETCKTLDDPRNFFDPWDNENVQKFLHILKFFSLNCKCFSALMTNKNESHNHEERDCPLNLVELFIDSVNYESEYHYLGLLSLHAVIWNLNVSIYLMELFDFQNILLDLQKSPVFITEPEDESSTECIIDDHRLLRHQILSQVYFVKYIEEEDESKSEEYDLPTLPPSKPNYEDIAMSSSDYTPETELENMLQDSKPGLLDSNWVMQIREAYKVSREPIKSIVILQLVDQMQKAIPTAEWVENFEWPDSTSCDTDFWFPEEIHGINIALYYAEQNEIMQDTVQSREKLQEFVNASYAFIQYERPNQFDGFDWFLSTIFIICEGDLAKSKSLLTHLMQFPATVFLWPALGKVVDKINNEECSVQFAFMQAVESIVSNELSIVRFALKSTCGMDWSMICNVLITQCFWGTLLWSQIVHFFTICILYSTDYIVYYCVSLLHHSQNILLQNVTSGKMWPENMVLDDYHCHNYITFMDTLGKKYANKVLPKMTIKEFDSPTET